MPPSPETVPLIENTQALRRGDSTCKSPVRRKSFQLSRKILAVPFRRKRSNQKRHSGGNNQIFGAVSQRPHHIAYNPVYQH